MISGCVIGESLRVGATFAPEGVTISKVTRADVSAGATAAQPKLWTVIDFTSEHTDPDALAQALAASLLAEGGWYADFRTDDEHVVVYADRIFRYDRTDAAGRAEAVEYGRSVGVPDHQLDWQD